MHTLESIRTDLYEQGQTKDALDAISELLKDAKGDAASELHALAAWCHFRRADYQLALTAIDLAGPENQTAKRCLLYVRSFGPTKDLSVTDDEEMIRLVQELGNDIDARNALVIRARQPDCQVQASTIWDHTQDMLQTGDPSQHDVKLANLCHNAGRFFHDKARDGQDLTIALGLFKVAGLHYGNTSHWHHRAALAHWTSKTLLSLGALPNALEKAVVSLVIWVDQLTTDPTNDDFKIKTSNACGLVAEITQQIKQTATLSE